MRSFAGSQILISKKSFFFGHSEVILHNFKKKRFLDLGSFFAFTFLEHVIQFKDDLLSRSQQIGIQFLAIVAFFEVFDYLGPFLNSIWATSVQNFKNPR